MKQVYKNVCVYLKLASHQDSLQGYLKMFKLGTENIRSVLKNLGLTEKETDIYVFIGQHGVQRSGEIAKGIKTHRAEVYRMLKSLQMKGFVQQTLESPSRFTAVSFEIIIDSFVKTKRQEASSIENRKRDLLEDWNILSKGRAPEPQPEKFLVMEGRHKIYQKILQMVNETKDELSTTCTVPALVRVDEFGILDAVFAHCLKSKGQFRFLVELEEQNLQEAKTVLKKISQRGASIKGRTPELGLKLYPQMVLKDEEEAVLFTGSQSDLPSSEQDNTCLWTNCKSLVRGFSAMFDESWRQATDIQEKMLETETGKLVPKTHVINDP